MDPPPGAKGAAPFGRYLLEELLARGGMGEVFRALAIGAGGFEKPVVVKRILPALGGVEPLAEMFVEEARLMSRLAHPNIVQVLDFGRGVDDDYFLVMELVDGVDLHRFCKAHQKRGEPVPVSIALHIVQQVLRGLGHAHHKAYGDGRTLVHRDVSPGNVLLSTVGEVKVADFGVALVARPGEASGHDKLVGKPAYMAPEQFCGDPLDARADLFSVAVVLFRLLTGEVPFKGEDAAAGQREAAAGRFRRATSYRDDLSDDLDAILEQALAPEPKNRFASARAMAKAIDGLERLGHAIATGDELAETVEQAQREVAAPPRPVVALAPFDEADGPTSTGRVRELTRAGPDGEFTWRLSTVEATDLSLTPTSDLSDPSLGSDPQVDRSSDGGTPDSSATPVALPVHRGRGLLVLAAVTGLGLFGYGTWWWVDRSAVESSGPERPTQTADPVAAPPSLASSPAPPGTGSAAAAPPSRSLDPRLSRPSSGRPVSPPVPSAGPEPTPSSGGSGSPPAPACLGQVLLAGKGSWWVSGGPGRVQAPGQYSWPCGAYQLTGTSRVDGRTVQRAITIRDGATASTRFE